MSKNALVLVTDNAISRINYLIQSSKSLGIRVGVKSGGCSGMKYFIEYAEFRKKHDTVLNLVGDTVLFIDAKALLYLVGSTIDYVQEQFREGFVFINPNEKSRCGCGKSFGI